MCGIVAVVSPDPGQRASAMLDAVRHRGPDGDGIRTFDGCSLAMARLAILDPTPRAGQPMSFGSSHLIYNGELYNFRELRGELEQLGVMFRTAGDTEVILHAIIRWGAVEACRRFRGMFAIALWDEPARSLTLARDRFGIKPLYWRAIVGGIAVASETRALAQSRGDLAQPVREFLALGSTVTALTEPDVLEIEPGVVATFMAGRMTVEPFPPLSGHDVPPVRAFKRAVERHLLSDRAVGLFLSGGFDSTALASVISRSEVDVTGLTIRHEHNGEDVAAAADAARRYGMKHEILDVRTPDVVERIPRFIAGMDQPSVDGFNTFLVSTFARELGIPVALSGLGADEVMGGYAYANRPRRRAAGRLWSRLPRRARSLTASLAARRVGSSRERVEAILGATDETTRFLAYRQLFSPDEISVLTGGRAAFDHPRYRPPPGSTRDRYAYLDFGVYLRGTLLRDADVFSMWNGVEVRVPFLDEDLVASASRQDPPLTKRALAEQLGDPGLAQAARAPKRTFALPWADWLPGVLLRWRDPLLVGPSPWGDVIDAKVARAILSRPIGSSAERDPHRAWALIALGLWLRADQDGDPS